MSGFENWNFRWSKIDNEPIDTFAARIEGDYAFIVQHDNGPTDIVTLRIVQADLHKYIDNLDQPRKELKLETTSIEEATKIADKLLVELGYSKETKE